MTTRIGYYGHSICTASASPGSYQQLLLERFPTLEIANTGAGNCSEERILYELKKTKNLDIAVIFHYRPGSIFVPESNRDIYTTHRELKETIEYQWEFEIESNKFRTIFPNSKTLFDTLDLYLTYLSNPDLAKNRFESALLAIDSYCLSGRVKYVLHVPYKDYIPSWFSFRSGVVDQELVTYAHLQGHQTNPNNVQDGMNELIANRLETLIAPYINNI
jgi:hypothetical protein